MVDPGSGRSQRHREWYHDPRDILDVREPWCYGDTYSPQLLPGMQRSSMHVHAHGVVQHTRSAAFRDVVDVGYVGCIDPGIQRSWDLDEWDHDPGDIQRMRSLVLRSYGDV
jgi:hypothetical protein